MIPLVDLKAQYAALKPDIDRAVLRVFDGAQFVLGPAVAAFEEDFAAFCQTTGHRLIGQCASSGVQRFLIQKAASGD